MFWSYHSLRAGFLKFSTVAPSIFSLEPYKDSDTEQLVFLEGSQASQSRQESNLSFRGNSKCSKTLSRIERIRTWWLKGRSEGKAKKDLEDLPESIKCLARCSSSPAVWKLAPARLRTWVRSVSELSVFCMFTEWYFSALWECPKCAHWALPRACS